MIAIDIETEPFTPHHKIRTAFPVPRLVCAAFAYSDGRPTAWGNALSGQVRVLLEEALDSGQDLVFHNAKFDLRSLGMTWPELGTRLVKAIGDGRVLDTLVLYWLHRPDSNVSKTLKSAYQDVCGKLLTKGEISTSFKVDVPCTPEQIMYNKQDAEATLAVAQALLTKPPGAGARRGAEFEIAARQSGFYNGQSPARLYSTAAAYLAFFMEPRGLPINRETLEALHVNAIHDSNALHGDLADAGLARLVRRAKAPTRPCTVPGVWSSRSWRPASRTPPLLARRTAAGGIEEVDATWSLSDRRLRDAFAAEGARLGLTVPLSDKGLPSLDYDFWATYRRDLPPALQTYLQLAKVRKSLSAFLDPLWVSGAEEVFPQYFIPGAETFRWACSAPNVQQLPKALRPIFGSRMRGADYKALECYTLAHCMAAMGIRGPFMEALNSADPHTLVATRLGCTRQQAKVATFGLGGGMGKRRFFEYMRYQCGIDVTPDQSSALRQGWLDLFWDVAKYLEQFKRNFYDLCPAGMSKAAWLEGLGIDLDTDTWPSSYSLSRILGGGFCTTLPSGRAVPNRNFSQAANMFFQGTGADVMTTAFVLLCKEGGDPLAVVHDSAYVGATPGEHLADVMVRALQTVCPSLEKIPRPEVVEKATFF